MIYLEIFELNFLNLNKDTMRSITSYKSYNDDYIQRLEVDDDDNGNDSELSSD